jgi:hypothetical protein
MASLIGRAFHWFGGRVSTRAHRTPVYLDDHTLRDIGLTRMEYHFLDVSGSAGARFRRRRSSEALDRTPDERTEARHHGSGLI